MHLTLEFTCIFTSQFNIAWSHFVFLACAHSSQKHFWDPPVHFHFNDKKVRIFYHLIQIVNFSHLNFIEIFLAVRQFDSFYRVDARWRVRKTSGSVKWNFSQVRPTFFISFFQASSKAGSYREIVHMQWPFDLDNRVMKRAVTHFALSLPHDCSNLRFQRWSRQSRTKGAAFYRHGGP